jgi:hypothetical protein
LKGRGETKGAFMRKVLVFTLCAALGALLMVYVSQSDWTMAALMGVALGLSAALFVYVYPTDLAPPADQHHEALMRRKALATKADFRTSTRT